MYSKNTVKCTVRTQWNVQLELSDFPSNSSDGSARSPFLDPNSVDRRGSRNVNLIEFEHDPDLDIPDDMVLWSQTHSQVTLFTFVT